MEPEKNSSSTNDSGSSVLSSGSDSTVLSSGSDSPDSPMLDEEYQGFLNELFTNKEIQKILLASGINDFTHDFSHAELKDFLQNVKNLNTTSMSTVQFEKRRFELLSAVSDGNEKVIKQIVTSFKKLGIAITAQNLKITVPSHLKGLKTVADLGQKINKETGMPHIYDIYNGIQYDGPDGKLASLLHTGGPGGTSLVNNENHFLNEDKQMQNVVGFNIAELRSILNPQSSFPVNLSPAHIIKSLDALEDTLIRKLNTPQIPEGEELVDRSVKITLPTGVGKPVVRSYNIHPVPVKITGKRVYLPGAIKRATGGSVKVAILIDASNLSVKSIGAILNGLTEEYGPNQPITILFLVNNPNLADSAMKIANQIKTNDNLTILFGRQAVGSWQSYPRPDDKEVKTQNKALFNNFTKNICKKESERAISGTIEFREYAEAGRPVKTFKSNDLGEESEIGNVAGNIVADFLLRDGVVSTESMVRGNTKKMGDSNQAISLLNLDDEYYFCDIAGRPTDENGNLLEDGAPAKSFTLRELKTIYGFVIYLLTHDKVLLSIALLLGINILYTLKLLFRFAADLVKEFGSVDEDDEDSKSKSITWLIGFKNALDIQELPKAQIDAAIGNAMSWLEKDVTTNEYIFRADSPLQQCGKLNTDIAAYVLKVMGEKGYLTQKNPKDVEIQNLLKFLFAIFLLIENDVPTVQLVERFKQSLLANVAILEAKDSSTSEKYGAISNISKLTRDLAVVSNDISTLLSPNASGVPNYETAIATLVYSMVGKGNLTKEAMDIKRQIDALPFQRVRDNTLNEKEWIKFKDDYGKLLERLETYKDSLYKSGRENIYLSLPWPQLIVSGLLQKTAAELAANQGKKDEEALQFKLAVIPGRVLKATPVELKLQWLYEQLYKSLHKDPGTNGAKKGGGVPKRQREKGESKEAESNEEEAPNSYGSWPMDSNSSETELSSGSNSNSNSNSSETGSTVLSSGSNSNSNENTEQKRPSKKSAKNVNTRIMEQLLDALQKTSKTVLYDQHLLVRDWYIQYGECAELLRGQASLKDIPQEIIDIIKKTKKNLSRLWKIFNHKKNKLIYGSSELFPLLYYLDSYGRKYELTRKFASTNDTYIEVPILLPSVITKIGKIFFENHDTILKDSTLHLYFLTLRLHFYETKLIQLYEKKKQYQKYLLKQLLDDDENWMELIQITNDDIYNELHDNITEVLDDNIQNYTTAFEKIVHVIKTLKKLNPETKSQSQQTAKSSFSLRLIEPSILPSVSTPQEFIDITINEQLNEIREISKEFGSIPELSKRLSQHIEKKNKKYYPISLFEMNALISSLKDEAVPPEAGKGIVILLQYDEQALNKLILVEQLIHLIKTESIDTEYLNRLINEANEYGLFEGDAILHNFLDELKEIAENGIEVGSEVQHPVVVLSKEKEPAYTGNGPFGNMPGNEHIATLSLTTNFIDLGSNSSSEDFSQYAVRALPLEKSSPTKQGSPTKPGSPTKQGSPTKPGTKTIAEYPTLTSPQKKALEEASAKALAKQQLLSPATSRIGLRMEFKTALQKVEEKAKENENAEELMGSYTYASPESKNNEDSKEGENEDENEGTFFMGNLPPTAPKVRLQEKLLTAAVGKPQWTTIVDQTTTFYRPLGFLFTTALGEQLTFDRNLQQIAGPLLSSKDLELTPEDLEVLQRNGVNIIQFGLPKGGRRYVMTRKNRRIYRKTRKH